MDWFGAVEWDKVLLPDRPLLEIFIRGSIIYLSLFFLLRVILKRQAGTVGISDLLVIVLIADAAQNGMAGDYKSVPDGIALVVTLIFWNYALEWLGFHFPAFDKVISPSPIMLIKNGRMIRKNMRKELITKGDLFTQLRLQGIEDVTRVKQACLEGDSKIRIIEYEKSESRHTTQDATVT